MLPPRAGHLLEVLGLLHAFSLAARLPAAHARLQATTAIGEALCEQVAIVARLFG